MKTSSRNDIPLDFNSVRERLALIAQTRFPDWTDHATPSFGNALFDMQAFIADVLSFYIEAQGREARLATAVQRRNVVAIARMLGYRPRQATAASTRIVFRLRRIHPKPVVVPVGFRVRTARNSNPQVYELEAAVTIAAGALSGSGTAEASSRRRQVFDMSGVANQSAVLTFGPYLNGSLDVRDAYGHTYSEVQTFVDSKATDRHFIVSLGENARPSLMFGDGILGAPPRGRVDIAYKTGGGASGMVEANTLTVTERPVLDEEGRPVEVLCTNPEASLGGSDEEDIESIRTNAPRHLRVCERSVTREDFEVNAKRLDGVARSLMLTRDEDDSIPENSGRLFIVPKSGGTMSRTLKDALTALFLDCYPPTLTFQLNIESAVYMPIDVTIEVDLALLRRNGENISGGTGHRRETVRKDIQQAVNAFFALATPNGAANDDIDFGFNLRGVGGEAGVVAWSDVLGVVRSASGVRKVNELTLNGGRDVVLSDEQFPVVGNVTVRFADETGEVAA